MFSPLGENGSSTNTVKKIYFADNISIPLRMVIDSFNAKYKGQIEVEMIDLPFEKFSTNDRKELLARYLRNKSERIDIFAVDEIWVPRFAKWAIPLNNYFNTEEKNQILSYAVNSCIYKDSLMAIPLYLDIALMYYRNDLLSKFPNYLSVKKEIDSSIEWESFIKLATKNKSKSPFYLFQADNYEGLVCSFIEMIESQNAYFIEGNTINLKKPEIRKSLQLLVDLVNKYKISPMEVTNSKEKQTYLSFVNNNGIFLRGWPGFMDNEFRTISQDENLYKNIFKAPLPHFKGFKAASIFGGWNLMVSLYSNKKPEAITFIKYLLKPENQKILLEKGGYLPINNKLYEDSLFVKTHPDLSFYNKLFKAGVTRPRISKYTYLSDVLSYFINKAIKKEISVSDALNKAELKINSEKILAE